MKKLGLLLAALLATGATLGFYARADRSVPGDSGGSAGAGHPLLPERIAGIGYVEPAAEIRRLVFPVDGVIAQCAVNVGDRARCGQLLVALRNYKEERAVELARREYELALADRKKVLAGVEHNELECARRQCELSAEKLRHAEVEHERYSTLQKSRAATGQEFDHAKTALKQAQVQLSADQARLKHLEQFVRPEDAALADAKVAVAKERIEVAQKALDDTFLRAPCDGTVLEILKREGDGTRVLDGLPAVIFADLSHMHVRAEIDERYVHLLSASMPAVVTGRAVGFREFHGKVVRVNRIMGPKTVFARVADERRDLDVVQVLIDMGPDFQFPVGLRTDVYLRVEGTLSGVK